MRKGKAAKGQIEEFLRQFNGEGIQHIALITDDLPKTWDRLKTLGVPFMTAPPETYYEMLDERLPGHGQPVDELKARGILLDGTTEGVGSGGRPRLLLQIFAEPRIGPVFFEFIERRGDYKKASAKGTSRHCSNPSSAIRCGAAC
jgi:4-hydroxyphenylpyruvate dioxygenase